MNLRQAIENVLNANFRGIEPAKEALDRLNDEVAEKEFVQFVVPSPDIEDVEPESHTFGTRSELNAFMQGADACEGWLEPAFFGTEAEALEYIKEKNESGIVELDDLQDEE